MSLFQLRSTETELSLDQIYFMAVRAAEELADRLLVRSANAESFCRVDRLLGALPLPQERYAWVAARLANARAYLLRDEPCAAAYEARLLSRRLAVELCLAVRQPAPHRSVSLSSIPAVRRCS